MRRTAFIAGAAAAAPLALLGGSIAKAGVRDAHIALDALEKRVGGRIGCAILDTAGRSPHGAAPLSDYRGRERFPFCSSNKTSIAGAVLRRIDRGEEHLDRALRVPRNAVVHYSPLSAPHAGSTMTVRALLHAMLTVSDNTAFNVLVGAIGGLAAVRADARALGDITMRVDRLETSLNTALPGDARDTTTPIAAALHLARLIDGDGLLPASRALLIGWMRGATTGLDRLRAGVPSTWTAGDKTGTGDRGATADAAFFYRPGGARPLIVVAYYAEGPGQQSARNAVFAEIGRSIVRHVTPVRQQPLAALDVTARLTAVTVRP